MIGWRHGVSFLATLVLAGCGPEEDETVRWSADGFAMGSPWRLVVMGDEKRKAECQDLVEETLEENVRRFSTWRRDSELSRINENELAVEEASEAFRDLHALAVSIREASGGAFDERLGRAVRSAGFAPPRPDDAGGEERAELDFCGIAKGFAVDEVCRELQGLGCGNFVFEHGGEVRAVGAGKEGDGWKVGVEAPEPGGRKIASVVPLFNQSMATSGNYRQFLPADDGQLLSHLIDPASDYPVIRKPSSVTVIAESCAIADAWATALFVIGQGKEAERLAKKHGLRVMWDGR